MRSLEEIYAQVPEVHCKGLCTQACGPVLASPAENQIILERHGSLPLPLPNLQCDKLKEGRCSIYSARPLVCRLFGAVREMRCPFGCVPRKFLSDRDASALLRATNSLPTDSSLPSEDGPGCGARAINDAIVDKVRALASIAILPRNH